MTSGRDRGAPVVASRGPVRIPDVTEDRRTPVIVASNRGPVSFEQTRDGSFRWQRGSGGLVTALTGALEASGGEWIAAAMSEDDRRRSADAGSNPIDLSGEGLDLRVRLIDVPEHTYDRYYNWVANGMLWFAHHYLWDTVRSPNFFEDGKVAWQDYVEVNRMFADALAEEGERHEGEPRFLVQDYHLSLVPRMLRERRPDALIAHFSHTPFGGRTYLRVLPERVRLGVLEGMLGADVLGFHSHDWADNFLTSARSVPGARVDLARSRIRIEGREVAARVHPVSVDVEAMRALAASPEARMRRADLERWRGDARLLLRVDRLELTKNIVRGFTAYEEFLRIRPAWRGRVKFLAMLSPSRQELPEYRAYTEECVAEAERVNSSLGTASWTPIDLRVEEDYVGALAAYQLYDVLLVNPIIDGMNLVAMEGPVMNRRHGALALSRNAGAFGRLGRYALGLNPFDIEETAETIAEALEMPRHERARRARGLSRLVLANPPGRWVREQLQDLERARARRAAAR
jgi:trehalose 6-phosphate synthase